MTKVLEISDKIYEQIKDQLSVDESINISALSDLIGQKLFIRTVTYNMTGKVTKLVNTFIQLEDAAWITDSGRFSDAIEKGTLVNVEPVGTAWVNLSNVVDFFLWKHELPTTTICSY